MLNWKRLLQTTTLGSTVLCLLLWLPNYRDMFWWRRTSLFVAGVTALTYLYMYERAVSRRVVRWWPLTIFMGLSTLLLMVRSPGVSGLIGQPLVHPAALSLMAAIAVGLFLAMLPRRQVLQGFFYITLWWALVCVMFWLDQTPRGRLGFVDSQVIYAAYLFMAGIIVGTWLQTKQYLEKRVAALGVGFLLLCLLLTQTRSALVITALYLAWAYRQQVRKYWAVSVALTVLAAVLAGSGWFARLSDGAYFSESVRYRLHLAQASFSSKPTDALLGGGVGGIDRNIEQNRHKYEDLAVDPQELVRFESSHNYLIDLLVERGLVVAGLFIWIVTTALHKPADKDSPAKAVVICTVAYLLVNNINLQMELLLWVTILMQLFGESDMLFKRRTKR